MGKKELEARLPPHHADAEKSVLGSMLISDKAAMAAIEELKSEDFYDPAHREIFSAMCRAAGSGKKIDVVVVDEMLGREGKLEGVGGFQYLMELNRFVPSAANVQAYIKIVDEKATLRRLMEAGGEISRLAGSGMDTAEVLARSEKMVYDISMRKGGEMLEPIQPVLLKTYEKIEQLAISKGRIEGVTTGYSELDDMLTGLHGGELVLIAARPSMGKTAFGMNIVGNAAIRQGKKAAVFSLEMPAEQLAMRMLCTEARVNMQSVRRGELEADEWMRLCEAMAMIGESKIYIDATSGITVPEMRSKARRLQMEGGLDLIMVDYLQLMSGAGQFGSRQEEIAGISRALKGLAQELDVPIVALSQLSRAPAGRTNHRPMLSDIRDSGAIEQDADVVMFVHREEYYDPDTEDRDKAEIIIAKQRNGSLGTVKLGWHGPFTWFVDCAQNN